MKMQSRSAWPLLAACALVAASSSHAAGRAAAITTPLVLYTDTPTAPTHGGEAGLGGYLSIFGRNFGTDPSRAKVFVGGIEVANYRYFGPSKVGAKLGIQQITVQLGGLGNAPAGTALPVVVKVDGVASNADQLLTPSGGRVLFVSLAGDDGHAVADDIAHPWRNLQNVLGAGSGPFTGAYFAMKAGDQVVLRGGNWSDANGLDSAWLRFAPNSYVKNGTPTAWIHFTAYPRPAGENAIEVVHYTTPAGTEGGIAGAEQAAAGTTGEYVAVSNLQMEQSPGSNRDAAPVNFQYSAGHWRVTNNELGPWRTSGKEAILNAGGVAGHGDQMAVLGNHIHDIAGTADLQNHGIYADTTAQNWDIGYNWIHDITGGTLVQFNDSEGGAGTYKLPHGAGKWPGFVGMHVHHNWLENSAKYGVNYSDQGSTKKGTYDGRIWNNVIIGTGWSALRILSTQPTQTIWFADNTLYDCVRVGVYSGDAYVLSEGWSSKSTVANKFYDNLFAFGPHTTAGGTDRPATQWFTDAGAKKATRTTYDFKGNLYFAAGQSPTAPSAIGDTLAKLGDPLFVNAAGGDLRTQPGSPARNAAAQPLPAGFTVVDDFTTLVPRAATGADIGAYVSTN